MVKRCIGIDIGPSHLRAVQISRTGEKFCVEKVFGIQTRRSTDSSLEILRSLTSRFGFDRHADVAISMPNDAVFFKNLETDFAALGQLRTGNFSLLEHNFPIQPDEIVGQVCSYRRLPEAENWSVLAAAVTRASLHETLETLAGAKMHPRLVDAPIFAIHAAVVVNHPEIMTGQAIIAYIDESHLVLAVTGDGDILLVRNIPIAAASDSSGSPEEQIAAILACETHVSWQRVFGTDIGQEIKIYLVTTDACEYPQSFIEENLHCQATIVDPYARVEAAADCLVWEEPSVSRKADFSVCVAEGLALRVLAAEQTKGLNFLQPRIADIGPKLNLKKELITCAALVGAIAVFWLVGLFVRLSYLEADYARVKDEIKEVFQTALPDEKNIVNPLVQLEQKLASFRKDYQLFASFYPAALGPLEVLRSISITIPSQANLKVDDLLIGADTVSVKGTSDSFESVYQWQRLLCNVNGFRSVDVQNVQKEPRSGIVHFTIVLSSALPFDIMEQK